MAHSAEDIEARAYALSIARHRSGADTSVANRLATSLRHRYPELFTGQAAPAPSEHGTVLTYRKALLSAQYATDWESRCLALDEVMRLAPPDWRDVVAATARTVIEVVEATAWREDSVAFGAATTAGVEFLQSAGTADHEARIWAILRLTLAAAADPHCDRARIAALLDCALALPGWEGEDLLSFGRRALRDLQYVVDDDDTALVDRAIVVNAYLGAISPTPADRLLRAYRTAVEAARATPSWESAILSLEGALELPALPDDPIAATARALIERLVDTARDDESADFKRVASIAKQWLDSSQNDYRARLLELFRVVVKDADVTDSWERAETLLDTLSDLDRPSRDDDFRAVGPLVDELADAARSEDRHRFRGTMAVFNAYFDAIGREPRERLLEIYRVAIRAADATANWDCATATLDAAIALPSPHDDALDAIHELLDAMVGYSRSEEKHWFSAAVAVTTAYLDALSATPTDRLFELYRKMLAAAVETNSWDRAEALLDIVTDVACPRGAEELISLRDQLQELGDDARREDRYGFLGRSQVLTTYLRSSSASPAGRLLETYRVAIREASADAWERTTARLDGAIGLYCPDSSPELGTARALLDQTAGYARSEDTDGFRGACLTARAYLEIDERLPHIDRYPQTCAAVLEAAIATHSHDRAWYMLEALLTIPAPPQFAATARELSRVRDLAADSGPGFHSAASALLTRLQRIGPPEMGIG